MFQRVKLKRFQDLSPIEVIEVAKWRNDYRIRKYMENRRAFSLKSHKNFIAHLDFPYMKVGDFGCFNLKKTSSKTIELGLFKNPRKKRVGDFIMQQAMKYIFTHYPEYKIILRVYAFNKTAIKLYQRWGFKIKRKVKKIYIMEYTDANRKV